MNYNKYILEPILSTYLGIQQCFGVVYHEFTTLRRVYFARAALAVRGK